MFVFLHNNHIFPLFHSCRSSFLCLFNFSENVLHKIVGGQNRPQKILPKNTVKSMTKMTEVTASNAKMKILKVKWLSENKNLLSITLNGKKRIVVDLHNRNSKKAA